MKFTNILFVGAVLVESTEAFKLQSKQIDVDAAKSAAHAAATWAKENGRDQKHAVSQANATIKHYDGATAQSHVQPDIKSHAATSSKSSMHESDSKHDTKVKAGVPGPKEIVHQAAAKAKAAGKDPTAAAKEALKKIAQSASDAGIKPGPKNVVAATAHMAKDAGHDPKTAAIKATKKITGKAKEVSGVPVVKKSKSAPVKAKAHKDEGLHEPDSKHDTKIKAGTPGPKAVVKMAATKAKKEGKDPVKAAKAAVAKITKAGGQAGIKPGPKQVVQHAAKLAKEQGHDPKKAAAMATKKITDAAKHMDKKTGVITKAADTAKPAVHAAAAKSMHESKSKHDTQPKAGVPGPKEIVKAAAMKGKKMGRDPATFAKAAIQKMAKEAHKAGIKPGPKNVVSATAHMAKDAGHDPKKAAVMATKKITGKAKKISGVPVHDKAPVKAIADSVKPAAHAAIASTK